MSDRALLEAAARAAGVNAVQDPNGFWRNSTGADPMRNIYSLPRWNPLTDDGDALRLAVKLEIHVQIGPLHVWASTPKDHAIEHMTGDPYAATRRAIVRAAAALGADK